MLLVVSSSALPLDNLLARGTEFLGKCFCNRLSFARLDYRLETLDVSCLAYEAPLFLQIRKIHLAQFLAQPPPEHLHWVEVGALFTNNACRFLANLP